MEWRTKLTELFGCKYPIIEGALAGFGTWNLAAAVSEAGATGCLTAHVYKTPEMLREAIGKLREATKNPFMVNISIGVSPNMDEMLDVCIKEKVPVIETSVFRPDAYAGRIKESGIKWIHKGATVDFIKHAERLGADAVVLVGADGYGFKSIRQLPTFTSIAWARRQIGIPLIAAGGIGDARTMLAALMAGADGVYLGSAFMATKECSLSENIKRNMISASPDHPDLIRELLASPNSDDYKKVMELKGKMPLDKWLSALEKVMLKHDDWRDEDARLIQPEKLRQDPDAIPSLGSRPKGPFSFVCGYIDEILTVQEFIDNMVQEAEQIMTDIVRKWRLV